MGLTITGRRVLEELKQCGPGDASISKLAVNLDMHAIQVRHVLSRQLEPVGEAFQAGGKWIATDAVLVLKYDPKAVLERMKRELENFLFEDGKPPDHIIAFLEEYRAARNLPTPLSTIEAFRFARRRVLRVRVD